LASQEVCLKGANRSQVRRGYVFQFIVMVHYSDDLVAAQPRVAAVVVGDNAATHHVNVVAEGRFVWVEGAFPPVTDQKTFIDLLQYIFGVISIAGYSPAEPGKEEFAYLMASPCEIHPNGSRRDRECGAGVDDRCPFGDGEGRASLEQGEGVEGWF